MSPVPASAASYAYLALLFIGLPVLAARTHRSGAVLALPRAALYVSAVISQWLAFLPLLLVLWLEDAGPRSVGLAPLPVGAAIAWTLGLVAAGIVVLVAARAVLKAGGGSESRATRHLIPRTARERAIFALLVAPTAGFVEEVLYRGFAVSRLAGLVDGAWPAAALAAIAFGLGHVYQGRFGASRAGLLGLVLTVPFLVTGSILPSIAAHAAIDALAGAVFGRAFAGEDPAEEGATGPAGEPKREVAS